jgi:hypothetical protein
MEIEEVHMSEFELLDFDDDIGDPTEFQPEELPDSLFLDSARERLDEHNKSLQAMPVPLWQELITELQVLPVELQQKLAAKPCAIPALSLKEGALLLESLQPLLKKPGLNRLVYPLYHGLAADHFLLFYRA